mmetsp:Transcript_3154/g.11355  ORF Transcript_3154/g.11355 Transcript_3154/m.11355 type:complete len:277 (+) Transcript_3154:673-1503(+)
MSSDGAEWTHGDIVQYTQIYGTICILSAVVVYGYVLHLVPPERRDGKRVSFKERLSFFLMTAPPGFALEIAMALMSIGSCVVFVWESYLDESPLWMFWTELFFSTYFAFQYFLGMYVSGNKIAYMMQLQPVVDAATVTPVFFLFFTSTYSLSGGNVGFLRFSRIMKFARVLRLLRLLRLRNRLPLPPSPVSTSRSRAASSPASWATSARAAAACWQPSSARSIRRRARWSATGRCTTCRRLRGSSTRRCATTSPLARRTTRAASRRWWRRAASATT